MFQCFLFFLIFRFSALVYLLSLCFFTFSNLEMAVKVACRSPKTGLTRGVSQKKLAPEAYRAVGGVVRNCATNRAILGH